METMIGWASTLLSLLFGGCFLWYTKLRRRKQQRPFPDVPYCVPAPHWLLGHLRLLGRDVLEGQRRLCVEHASDRGVCTFWTLGTPSVSLLNAKDVKRVFGMSSDRRGNPQVTRHFRRLFGESSLLMLNGKEWKKNREIVHRSLKSSSIPQLNRALLKASRRVAAALANDVGKGSLQVDALDLSRMAVLDVFGLSCLGFDFHCTSEGTMQPSIIFRQLGFLQSECTRRCYTDRFNVAAQFYSIPTPANRRFAREHRDLRRTLKEIVADRRATSSSPSDDTILLDNLLHGESAADDDYLADWLITMLLGQETSAIGMCYTLFFLAKYPHIQEECRREVARAQHTDEFDATVQLPFLYACFWEAVRMFPPTTVTARNPTRSFEVEVDGKQLSFPGGTRVVASIYWIHRSEQNFPRPNEYLPERWVHRLADGSWGRRTETVGSGEVPAGDWSSNMAFSVGGRNCVGKPLALRMIPTILAQLLLQNRFRLMDDGSFRLKRFGASAIPDGGLPLVVDHVGGAS